MPNSLRPSIAMRTPNTWPGHRWPWFCAASVKYSSRDFMRDAQGELKSLAGKPCSISPNNYTIDTQRGHAYTSVRLWILIVHKEKCDARGGDNDSEGSF